MSEDQDPYISSQFGCTCVLCCGEECDHEEIPEAEAEAPFEIDDIWIYEDDDTDEEITVVVTDYDDESTEERDVISDITSEESAEEEDSDDESTRSSFIHLN